MKEPDRFRTCGSSGGGVVKMLCGKMPFQPGEGGNYALAVMHMTQKPPSLLTHNPDLPIQLDALVQRCLSKSPEHRPTAGELAALIRSIVPGSIASEDSDRKTSQEA